MLQPIITHTASCPFLITVSNETDSSNHFHHELELIFLLSGRLSIACGGSHYNLRSRDFILVNPYEIHAINFVSDDCYYVHFLIQERNLRFLFSTQHPLSFQWQESLNNRQQPLYQEISAAARNIVIEGGNQERDYVARIYQEVVRILIALNRWCGTGFHGDTAGKKPAGQQQKSNEIMNYINNHYTEQISLNSISKALFLSPPYISKIFKESFQVGVLEYLNRLRIQKSIFPLCHSTAFIADIAEDCGFTNAKTYSRIFQKEMGISPTDYRKQYTNEESETTSLFTPSRSDYIQLLDLNAEAEPFTADTEITDNTLIRFDFTSAVPVGSPHVWNRVLYAGIAELLLKNSIQQTVRQALEDFDYEYLRITGVFSDGLQTYQEDENGNPHYFWMLLDEILRFITSLRMKPFLSLGYMPRLLASRGTPSPFHWQANISAPKSMDKWCDYLRSFLHHLIRTYSYKEVCSWRFEFWNDPFLPNAFWIGSEKAFYDFFLASYQVFREVLPDGQFGSPGFIYYEEYQAVERFLSFCKSKQVDFNFLSLHLYDLTDPKNPGSEHLNNFRKLERQSLQGPDFIKDAVLLFQQVAHRAGYDTPLAVTEWNISPYFHDLSRDTCFMSTYIADTINQLPDCVRSLSFWSLTDDTDEHTLQQDIFSGELGQKTTNGLEKPSYLVFKLLKQLHGDILESGKDYFITHSARGYHIFLYNYCYYNEDFLNGQSRPLSRKDRYQIFEPGHLRRFALDLTLEPGQYRIERHILDREHGSIYDSWIHMGAPEFLDSTCNDYLNKTAYPDVTIQHKNIHSSLHFTEQVPQHGVLLLNLIRLGDEL